MCLRLWLAFALAIVPHAHVSPRYSTPHRTYIRLIEHIKWVWLNSACCPCCSPMFYLTHSLLWFIRFFFWLIFSSAIYKFQNAFINHVCCMRKYGARNSIADRYKWFQGNSIANHFSFFFSSKIKSNKWPLMNTYLCVCLCVWVSVFQHIVCVCDDDDVNGIWFKWRRNDSRAHKHTSHTYTRHPKQACPMIYSLDLMNPCWLKFLTSS